MPNALHGLIALGPQNKYINVEDPTKESGITFFSKSYKRSTLFVRESLEMIINGTSEFGKKIVVTVPRSGDLLNDTYVNIDLPALTAPAGKKVSWVPSIGHYILETVTLNIGQTKIDSHNSRWMHIQSQLTHTGQKKEMLNRLIGNIDVLTTPAETIPAYTIQVPLIFWFMKDPAAALQLLALHGMDVNLEIELRRFSECHIVYDQSNKPLDESIQNPGMGPLTVWGDYIFLSEPERQLLIRQTSVFTYETMQFNGSNSYNSNSCRERLALNHPVAELFWTLQLEDNTAAGRNRWCDFTMAGTDDAQAYNGDHPLASATLLTNNIERMKERTGHYFGVLQPYKHHTGIPDTGIYCYGFYAGGAALSESLQPSGTLNFSRLNDAMLVVKTNTGSKRYNLDVYARSFNVLATDGVKGTASVRYSS